MRFVNLLVLWIVLLAAGVRSDVISEEHCEMMKVAFCDGKTGTSGLEIRDAPKPKAGEGEALVRVAASGLNRIDTYMSKGAFGKVDVLGMEIAGTVEAVGTKCSSAFKKGSRVMALLSDGGHSQYVSVDESMLMPVPDTMTFEQAAAVPEQWLTAFQLLRLVGEVRKGDTVLIHAGGSGVGTAAVQLVRAFGATAWVTAGSKAKIDNAIRLGASGGFNYKTEDWGELLLKATGNRGVDVILDCVGGSHAPNNAKVLAMDSRWVLFGLMGGADAPGKDQGLLRQLLRKRASIRGTTLRTRSKEYKRALTKRFRDEVLPLLAKGDLKVIIDSTFPFAKVTDAYSRLVANKNIGKIVISGIGSHGS